MRTLESEGFARPNRAWIRGGRNGWSIENERRPNGSVERVLTIFIAGAECPFTCSFCDLWRYTIDGPTPAGAVPRQLEDTLRAVQGVPLDRIKLYNASNFFDRRSIPDVDANRIAELCATFSGVTVESHASTLGPATRDFARRLRGRLEVAIGLETIHPEAIRHLKQAARLDLFARAASTLGDNGIDLPRVRSARRARCASRNFRRLDGAKRGVRRFARIRDRIDHPGPRRQRRDGAAGRTRPIHAADAGTTRTYPRSLSWLEPHRGRGGSLGCRSAAGVADVSDGPALIACDASTSPAPANKRCGARAAPNPNS